MKLAFLGVILAAPAAAIAQTSAAAPAAPVVKAGRMLSSSDGHRLGRIDQLDKGPDGTPVTAELFSDQGVLYVPVSTLSSTNGTSFVTSMTYAQVTNGK
ncbi:hypothetical protein [Sphingomonas oryzagri]